MFNHLQKYHSSPNREFILYNCQHFGAQDFDDTTVIESRIQADLSKLEANLDKISNNKKNCLILNFLQEGADPVTSKKIIDIFKEFFDANHILAFYNAIGDVDDLEHQIVICPWNMVSHNNIDQTIPLLDLIARPLVLDKKILCLIRRPSWGRAKFAYALTNSVDPESLRISFGSITGNQTGDYQDFFNSSRLPLIINGVADFVSQHDQTDLVFHKCLFNVVVETSSQTDKYSWRTKFVTEKTFKAFLLRQIPIWFGVPGLVAEIRKLGFDMFDDVVNHDYDLLANEHQRITAIVEQLKKIDQALSLHQCQQLRNDLWDRFNSNLNLVKYYAKENITFVHDHQQKFIKETD